MDSFARNPTHIVLHNEYSYGRYMNLIKDLCMCVYFQKDGKTISVTTKPSVDICMREYFQENVWHQLADPD